VGYKTWCFTQRKRDWERKREMIKQRENDGEREREQVKTGSENVNLIV
jgi:hypothetical protein